MSRFLGLCFGTFLRLFRSHHTLLLENLALRQQLVVLKEHHPRPKLYLFDKLFWLLVRRRWLGWKQALLVVTPETVVRWHRAGFRWYWRVISRVRKPVGKMNWATSRINYLNRRFVVRREYQARFCFVASFSLYW